MGRRKMLLAGVAIGLAFAVSESARWSPGRALVSVLEWALESTPAWAEPSPGPSGGGGSGEIPIPFQSSNQKVELASGELYILIGRISFYNGAPYLEVDLEQHPWLANKERKGAPFYPLEASADYWRRFEGQQLKTFMEAHGAVRLDDPSGPKYVLSLFPLADPLPVNRPVDQRNP